MATFWFVVVKLMLLTKRSNLNFCCIIHFKECQIDKNKNNQISGNTIFKWVFLLGILTLIVKLIVRRQQEVPY